MSADRTAVDAVLTPLLTAVDRAFRSWKTVETTLAGWHQAQDVLGREVEFDYDVDLDNPQVTFDANAKKQHAYFSARATVFSASQRLSSDIGELRSSMQDLDKAIQAARDCAVQDAKLTAAMLLAEQLQNRLAGRPESLTEALEEKTNALPDRMRASPAQSVIDSASASLQSTLDSFFRACRSTNDLMKQLQLNQLELAALDKEVIEEPKKPTAEEVARYLHEMDEWTQRRLASERHGSQVLGTAQKALAAMQRSMQECNRVLGKLGYLENREADAALVGKLWSLRHTLEQFTRYLEPGWSKDLRKISEMKLESSHAGNPPRADDAEFLLSLQEATRAIGFALAYKNVAKDRHDAVKGNTLNPLPLKFNTPSVSATLDAEDVFTKGQEYLTKWEETVRANEKIVAEQTIALETLMARRAKLQEAAQAANQLTDDIVKLTHSKTSEELRILIRMSRRLHKLFGPALFEIIGEVTGL